MSRDVGFVENVNDRLKRLILHRIWMVEPNKILPINGWIMSDCLLEYCG